MNKYEIFYLKIFLFFFFFFLAVKFSIYLNRRVLVMHAESLFGYNSVF